MWTIQQRLRGLNAYYRGGSPISTASYGDTITYNVPGQPPGQIWLEQYVNTALGYNGPFTIPMAPYTLSPKDQTGLWTSIAYSLVNGQKGSYLESSTLGVVSAPVIAPAPITQTGIPSIPAPSIGGGGTGAGTTQVNVNTAPSIPGALPSGGTVGASYNQNCLTGKYRFILATGGGFATGASLPGCSQTNTANCDPQYFSTLHDAINYALSRGEPPYKVDSAAEPWQLISCSIAPDPNKIYDANGNLHGGSGGITTLLIAAAALYFFGKSRSRS